MLFADHRTLRAPAFGSKRGAPFDVCYWDEPDIVRQIVISPSVGSPNVCFCILRDIVTSEPAFELRFVIGPKRTLTPLPRLSGFREQQTLECSVNQPLWTAGTGRSLICHRYAYSTTKLATRFRPATARSSLG